MRSRIVPADRKFFWLLLAAALVLLAAMLPAQSKPAERPAIYDPGADVKADIVAAVKRAGAENRNIPGFQEPGPVIRLYAKGGSLKLQPSGGRNLLVGTPYSEARWTWMPVAVPFAADKDWLVETSGTVSLSKIDAVSVSFDSWGGDPFTIWLDGLAFE